MQNLCIISATLHIFFSRAAVLILNYPKVLREPMANPLMRYGKKKLKPVI